MGKIEDFEKKLISSGMTDEDFVAYEKLLKRVRGNFSKRQHCYTTAIQFPGEFAEQAVKLIQYGLDNFDDGWFTTYTSYLFMGRIYEGTHGYQKAFDAYLLAKDALGTDHGGYVAELSIDLLWMKLHIDSFRYSPELEEYLAMYGKTADFSKSFINAEFKYAVANIVILLHAGKTEKAKQFHEKAKEICRPNYIGRLYGLLLNHHYREALKATPESIAFVKQLKL